jgi:ferredoxin
MTEYTVEFAGTGETITVADTEPILGRCIEAGIAQEFSCRVGMCLACSAKILEGDVTQPAAHALTDEQREEYALTCMARPQSDLVLDRGVYPEGIDKSEEAREDATATDGGTMSEHQ